MLACLAGVFPIRRALFGERWDFIAYLAHLARLTVGVAGFWLLLLFAPALVAWARPHVWPFATTLALVLVAWGLAYPWILLWVLGATPLSNRELEERFRAIAERSTAPRAPALAGRAAGGTLGQRLRASRHADPGGGLHPHPPRGLRPDELAAVFAHEQAHLEHFDARRVKRLAALQTLAVFVGTLGAAAAFERLGGASTAIILGWPLLLLVAVFVLRSFAIGPTRPRATAGPSSCAATRRRSPAPS